MTCGALEGCGGEAVPALPQRPGLGRADPEPGRFVEAPQPMERGVAIAWAVCTGPCLLPWVVQALCNLVLRPGS